MNSIVLAMSELEPCKQRNPRSPPNRFAFLPTDTPESSLGWTKFGWSQRWDVIISRIALVKIEQEKWLYFSLEVQPRSRKYMQNLAKLFSFQIIIMSDYRYLLWLIFTKHTKLIPWSWSHTSRAYPSRLVSYHFLCLSSRALSLNQISTFTLVASSFAFLSLFVFR